MKLTLSPCTVKDDGSMDVQKTKFEVMLNPETYKHEYSISYSDEKALGTSGSELKFNAANEEKISFELVFDGTGVVKPATKSSKTPDVKESIRKLNTIIYKYDGHKHEPNHVRLLWGSMIFFGRLTSINISYTLFKPDGTPLRAKVSLSFSGFMSKEEEALKADRSSPDLTHTIVIRDGDTLPLLCYRIYSDSSLYLRIARENHLSDFRNLKPGTTVVFPALQTLGS
jgi:hypothetical protein